MPEIQDTPPAFSLVICTRNRAAQLEQCLQSLKRLECKISWELIVVDNGSTDSTQNTLEKYRHAFPRGIKIVQEPTPGLGRARNRGWRLAVGEIVAFTDDDCYPHPTFLDEIAKAFFGRPNCGYVGGRILLFDPTDYRITIQERDTSEDFPAPSFIPAGLIQGANMAFRRTALEAVNGFDECFGAGALFPCEDVDILARLSAAGWDGAYDPAPLVYHHHGRKTQAEAQKLMKQYDRGRGAYFAKMLLNPVLRHAAFRYWFWQIRHQPLGTTAREMAAAMEYWLRRIL